MSSSRHPDSFIVRTLSLTLPDGFEIDSHAHDWHQLVYATRGVMTVKTSDGSWVTPNRRAIWIPAETIHSVRTVGVVRLRTAYVRPDFSSRPPHRCSAIDVSPLLRELILEAVRRERLDELEAIDRRLAGVLVDQIAQTSAAPLELPWPWDPRARFVADAAHADLGSVPALATLCRGSGASPRTIERRFVQETDLTFGRWLQRARALRALEHLASGDSVTVAGLKVGYDSTSAFIAMFRRVLGSTPGAYFNAADEQRPTSGT